MRVLLVSLNTVAEPFPVFPLGVAHLRDATAAAGHQVEIFDCLIDASEAALADCIERFAPDVVGVSIRNIDDVRADTAVSFVSGIRATVDGIRAHSPAIVVLGGAGYSIFPVELLDESGADFGICGEGELAFPQLLQQLQAGHHAIDRIAGLVYRNGDGAIHANPPARSATAAATFAPPPSWVAGYRARGAIFNVQTQRGCPLHCSYCTYPLIEGAQRRLHDYDSVVAQFRYWRDQGIRYLFITDSVLNTSARHLRDFARALIEADTGIEWGCFLRPTALQAGDLQLLADAGLRHIEFGSDSFSDSMLRSFGKSFAFPAIERASRLAHDAGIHFSHFLILGGPGESQQTLRQTHQRSATLPGGVFFAFPGVRVYPNTRLSAQLNARARALPANLLLPHFFIEDGLTLAQLTGLLEAWRLADPRWAPLTLPAQFTTMVRRLRARGIEGPLWEYLPWMAAPRDPASAAPAVS